MTDADAASWWSQILDLYVEYRLNIRDVEREFLDKATIRPGAKELFDLCAQRNVPIVILSAGIKDVIEIWARTYQVQPTIIHSTSLDIGSDGLIRGWDKDSLVHVLNKKEKGGGHDGIADIRRQRPMTLLVGDSLGDAAMAEGDEAVFRVLVHDPRPDENQTDLQERALRQFDAVIETGNMRAVQELVETIVS